MPNGSDLLKVGHTAGTHGLKGEVKLVPDTDDPTRLLDLESMWFGDEVEHAQSYPVRSLRLQQTKRGPCVLVRFDGCNSIEDANFFARGEAYAAQGDLPPLADDEFFLHDLIGACVWTESGQVVGRVREIWDVPAGHLYVVERDTQTDALIPAVPEFVTQVSVAESKIVIAPIEGLLD